MPSGGDDNPEDICQLKPPHIRAAEMKLHVFLTNWSSLQDHMGRKHKPSTLAGRWFVHKVITFVGIGMNNPSGAEDVHEPSEEILREMRPQALQKGGAGRNISGQHERNCRHT